MSEEEFCEICGVANALHDFADEDPCERAELEADRLDWMTRLMFGGLR